MILDDIVAHKHFEVERAEKRLPLDLLTPQLDDAPPVRDFRAALADEELAIIAEFKRASPSKGPIRPGAEPGDIARDYMHNGARALSVLTDQRYFQGHAEDLRQARETAWALPVLRKDFIVHPYQVYESRLMGADAILLIVRALKDDALSECLSLARELGMSALVECHDERDVRRAASVGAEIIGVNNRDLATFRVDVQTTLRLLPRVPEGATIVSESGIRTRQDVELLERSGVHAALIGETLMAAEDVGRKLRELLGIA
jgi:indole-3-glycerol phosphate synthase